MNGASLVDATPANLGRLRVAVDKHVWVHVPSSGSIAKPLQAPKGSLRELFMRNAPSKLSPESYLRDVLHLADHVSDAGATAAGPIYPCKSMAGAPAEEAARRAALEGRAGSTELFPSPYVRSTPRIPLLESGTTAMRENRTARVTTGRASTNTYSLAAPPLSEDNADFRKRMAAHAARATRRLPNNRSSTEIEPETDEVGGALGARSQKPHKAAQHAGCDLRSGTGSAAFNRCAAHQPTLPVG